MIKQPELPSESGDRYCNVTSGDSWDSNAFSVQFLIKNIDKNKQMMEVLHTPVCVGVQVPVLPLDVEGPGKARASF